MAILKNANFRRLGIPCCEQTPKYTMIRTVIIDDERQSHLALTHQLSSAYKDVEILAHGYNVAEGMDLINTYTPDLVFLDVEMPDGTGFELLQKIGRPAFYVVFITAFNKHAESAIRFGALDFLTKPIDGSLLAEAIQRVRDRLHERITSEQLQITLEAFKSAQQKKLPSRICVPDGDGFEVIALENIIHLIADKNMTEFHILNRTKRLISVTNIGTFEGQLEPYPIFWRTHRSHIVNKLMVDKYVKADGGYLIMKDGCRIPVSKDNKGDLQNLFSEI